MIQINHNLVKYVINYQINTIYNKDKILIFKTLYINNF